MTPEQFHTRMWEILEPVDTKVFEVVAAPAPDDQAIAAIEATVGFSIPKEFAAFSRRTNGLCVVAREEVWPPAKQFDVGPAWTFWRGLVLLGIDAPELPEWASISAIHRRLADNEVTGVLPLLKIIGASSIWGVDQAGTVVEVHNDQVTPLTSNFIDVYAEQISALLQRQKDMARKIAERR